MLNGIDKNINEQLEILSKILNKSDKIVKILKILEDYHNKNNNFSNYYLSAGCINQTVFNYYHGYELDYGIGDYDIVYFDDDTSYEAEDVIIKDLSLLLKDIDGDFDIKNEKRVPIWWEEKYHEKKNEYSCVENAIKRWGTTVTCIGVRLEHGNMKVVCPYGLNDLFELTIRPVKIDFKKVDYIEKTKKWSKKWPNLKIINWDD